MTVEIPLRGRATGLVALVDDADSHLGEHRWYLSHSGGRGYAFRTNNHRSAFMHKDVVGDVPAGMRVDHINRDRLDNRRANLRIVTHSENILNCERSDKKRDRVQHLKALHRDGLTRAEIAAKTGLSIGAVCIALHGEPWDSRMVWTQARLVEFVKDFHAENGRTPRQTDMDGRDGRPWFPTMYRRFPSLRAGVEAAGLEYVDGRTLRLRRTA